MKCGVVFHACMCGVEGAHTIHHCTTPSVLDGSPCDGKWADHDDPALAWVHQYPVSAADACGVEQPTDPIAAERYDDIPFLRPIRGGIRILPSPSSKTEL